MMFNDGNCVLFDALSAAVADESLGGMCGFMGGESSRYPSTTTLPLLTGWWNCKSIVCDGCNCSGW